MATSAWAEWTLSTESFDDKKYYLDFSTLEYDGNFVYAWIMTDFLKPDSDGISSNSMLYKTDCNRPKKYKLLSLILYKGSMGTGDVINSIQPPNDPWDYPPPGSVVEKLVSLMCSANSD